MNSDVEIEYQQALQNFKFSFAIKNMHECIKPQAVEFILHNMHQNHEMSIKLHTPILYSEITLHDNTYSSYIELIDTEYAHVRTTDTNCYEMIKLEKLPIEQLIEILIAIENYKYTVV